MTSIAWLLIAAHVCLFVYAYGLYPLLLRLRQGALSRGRAEPPELMDWPMISIVVTAYNAERTIRGTVERLLAVNYPPDRREVVVVSDASTDGTDDIVREFAARGVRLHRMQKRGGKTLAENAVATRVAGEIVVNVDSSVLVQPNSIKALVRHFADPTVGVASGTAISVPVPPNAAPATRGDAAYYDYEMWVRSLEMRFGAVIGATGGLYAMRREVYQVPLPAHVARDFASPLLGRERGYRSVIDDDAVCCVQQTPSLQREYSRKVRTMVRGLDTLYEFRHLMDPVRHGWFALMLVSHKLCRWLVYLTAPLAAAGLLLLAVESWPARVAVGAVLLVTAVGVVAMRWPRDRHVPALLALCGYAVVGGAAGAAAWRRFFSGDHMAVWEPTARAG
jgi:cellulose synthase/poly-beta-1,6-N-acetylglucosamine synthase-like glycosyltransferase